MIAGIDPGARGALALLSAAGDLIDVADMPTVPVNGKLRVSASRLAGILGQWKPRMAVIEQVGAMPGQGVSSMFAFGYAAGIAEGACAACGVSVQFTAPTVWKKAMKVTADKGACRLMAQRLWPAQAELFARVKDDGRAEAALIGFHGRKLLLLEAA